MADRFAADRDAKLTENLTRAKKPKPVKSSLASRGKGNGASQSLQRMKTAPLVGSHRLQSGQMQIADHRYL
jgi:hypothetical protein